MTLSIERSGLPEAEVSALAESTRGSGPVRLLFASAYPKTDSHGWYGPDNHIAKALRAVGIDVDFVGVELDRRYIGLRVRQWVSKKLGKRIQIEREPATVAGYARQVERQISRGRYDVLVSHGTLPIADLVTDLPTVLWTDATFGGLVGYYPEFSDFAEDTVRKGHAAEQRALNRVTLAIYTSNWARESAALHYRVPAERLAVVPFGANIEHLPTREETVASVAFRREKRPVRLLFIGGHWERKGGDIAIETAAHLHRRGVDVELAVLGSAPAGEQPAFVRRLPYISKHSEEGRKEMARLYSESHFLLLPSRAECNANVLAEGNAQGLPAIATDTGGISTSVRDGVNGRLFPLAARGDVYADAIEGYLNDPAGYERLCLSSYNEYATRLNWRTAAETVKTRIMEVCAAHTAERQGR